MRPIFCFTKEKFISLPLKQQHKKCAELLKALHQAPHDEKRAYLLSEYTKLCSYLNMDPILLTLEAIEARFHFHMRQTELGLSEDQFLINLQTQDKSEGKDWLSIQIYLDGLRSTHNVGSVLRTVEAFRLGAVHFSADMMPLDHPQIAKTSMGTSEIVLKHHGTSLSSLPRPRIALETVVNSVPWNEWIYPKQCTICVGNEERGIKKELLSQCDMVVSIPLFGQKNSLNVANAFAILASEISSQHRMIN